MPVGPGSRPAATGPIFQIEFLDFPCRLRWCKCLERLCDDAEAGGVDDGQVEEALGVTMTALCC